MRYLCAVGAPWGLAVVQQVQRKTEQWELVRSPEALRWTLQDLPAPRFVFCLNWSERVPESITSRFEVVNFHCTKLPQGRGGAPIENLIKQGHTETVITAHRMTQEIDAGPVYGVSEPVSLAGTKAQILERFIAPCVALIRHLVRFEPEPKPQVGKASYTTRLPDDEYSRLWSTRG